MRNKASLEFKNQAGQYDVATLSNFEIADLRQETAG